MKRTSAGHKFGDIEKKVKKKNHGRIWQKRRHTM
jgi:hypothetical protein